MMPVQSLIFHGMINNLVRRKGKIFLESSEQKTPVPAEKTGTI
jgi:hypothetical protein